jgi:hypothetical protein
VLSAVVNTIAFFPSGLNARPDWSVVAGDLAGFGPVQAVIKQMLKKIKTLFIFTGFFENIGINQEYPKPARFAPFHFW